MPDPGPLPPFAEPADDPDAQPLPVPLDEAYFLAEVERMEAEARRASAEKYDV